MTTVGTRAGNIISTRRTTIKGRLQNSEFKPR
jgi:hypothetical protein